MVKASALLGKALRRPRANSENEHNGRPALAQGR